MLDRAVLVRVMAVYPHELPRLDAVGAAGDANKAMAGEAKDELVAGEMVAPDVVVRAAHEMPGAGHRIEHFLMDGIGCREE
jgi:hypothetical protein